MQRVRIARQLATTCAAPKSAACVHYDATSSDVEALLHESLDKSRRQADGNTQLLTTNKDAINLYRDIWRYSRLFVWTDEIGRPWYNDLLQTRDVLRQSARQEFEAARHETDPIVVMRLLLTGRDAVMQAKDKFMDKRQEIENQELHPEFRG